MRRNLVPVAALAVLGSGFAAYAYFADRTGVTGSEGALLALIGALAVALGSLLACFSARRAVFGVLACLIALGAALTAVAGVFLMQYPLAVVMGLTLVGLVFALLRPAAARNPA